MIKVLEGVAFMTGMSYVSVHKAWKLARKASSANFQRGNYVLTFKTLCTILKVRSVHLPTEINETVFFMGNLVTIKDATPSTVSLTDSTGTTQILPLLNLILCERRQSNIQGNKAQAQAQV